MHWLTLFANIFLVLFSIYVWKRYHDKNYFWLFILNLVAIVVDFWNYYSKNILQLSDSASSVNNVSIMIFWVVYIVLMIYIFFKDSNKKVSFKKDKSLKEFRQNIDGFPQFLSINPNFKKFTEKSKYPYFFSIQIEITKKDSKGLPQGKEEIKNIDNLEDSIDKKIKSICDVYFIGRVTRNGFRYLYYYISKDIDSETAFKPHDSKEPKARLYYSSLEKDENWEIAAKYFKLIS